MNIRMIVGAAAVVAVVEIIVITNPEWVDDMLYSIGKIPQWFQANNPWLAKPKPPKN